MKKHFVTFFSPGTFLAEETTKEIPSWDVQKALKMSGEVVERYGALPYGFQFTTRERGNDDFDSKETARSNMYYLGGNVYTADELEALGDPGNHVLIQNMRINDWEKVIINKNSYTWVQPLEEGDVVLK